jgi:hypothetical protein
MSNTKKVTISLTPEQQEKARSLSKDLFGKENISGFIGFLIEQEGRVKGPWRWRSLMK